jgi:hypothetical protein
MFLCALCHSFYIYWLHLWQYSDLLAVHSSQHAHTAQLMLGDEIEDKWLV